MDEQPASLTWRPLTREDAKASADLLNAIETVDRIGVNHTYVQIRHKPVAEEVLHARRNAAGAPEAGCRRHAPRAVADQGLRPRRQ